MKIPNAKESISYCKKLGYELSSIEKAEETYWILEEKGIALSTWPSLLDVWVELARKASIGLHEEKKFDTFMAMYRCASSSRRHQMRAWAEKVTLGILSDPKMDAFLNLSSRTSVDDLPRNWKDKLVKIRSRPSGWMMFPQRAKRELERLARTEDAG